MPSGLTDLKMDTQLMSFGEFKDEQGDEQSLEEYKDIDQIDADASFDRKTDKKFENLSNIISEDQDSRMQLNIPDP